MEDFLISMIIPVTKALVGLIIVLFGFCKFLFNLILDNDTKIAELEDKVLTLQLHIGRLCDPSKEEEEEEEEEEE